MARLQEKHRSAKFPGLWLERRSSSRYWQARAWLDGKVQQKSMEHDDVRTAMKFAESWFKTLARSVDTSPVAVLRRAETLGELFAQFKASLATPALRAEMTMRWGPIRDFWTGLHQAQVTSETFHQFYRWRRRAKVSNSTLHKDVCTVRLLLRWAAEHGLRDSLPVVPKFGTIPKNPRPWLNRDEVAKLLQTSETRIEEVAGNTRLLRQRQDLDDFVRFMLDSMMRVDEVRHLTVGQCRPEQQNNRSYLIIDVKGKRGHRTAVARDEAARIFARRCGGLKPPDKLWKHAQRDGFRELLIASGLRTDAFGNARNLKSLRATSISLFILDNPKVNLEVIAKNAGTSIVQINDFYARRLTAELHVNELTRPNSAQTDSDEAAQVAAVVWGEYRGEYPVVVSQLDAPAARRQLDKGRSAAR
jgi:hypothetical protein